jgi:DNA-binding response OmpR family regulator
VSSDILVVEDEPDIRSLIVHHLERDGFRCRAAAGGQDALAAARATVPDLVVLDLMLPGMDGLEVCRRLRAAAPALPIIMLTAKADEVDRIVGLELGADDYLKKPFNPRELLARLRALVRRERRTARESASASGVLRFGRLDIDRTRRQVRLSGEERLLTGHQFDLLVALAENAGKVMTRDRLLRLVRGTALEPFDRSIDVHVSRIRAAVEEDPKSPRRILTIRGVGYVFVGEAS